jgi:glucokinase
VSADRVIGVDVGGTKILGALVGSDGGISHAVELPTPTTSEKAVLEGIADVVADLADRDGAAVGLGVPCNLDPRTGVAYRATNLPLDEIDLAGWMRQRFSLPVGVENDGNAAALAEWRIGAGRGARDLVMLTLGTGIGGGLVLDDRLYRGWAELGHVVVEYDGPPCQGNCHGRGHLEGVASGRAATRVARELFGPESDAHDLVDRARAGVVPAIEALAQIGRFLGGAVGSFVNMFNPDVVVVGGGFGSAAGDLVLGPAREAARREAIQPADATVRIVPAELGDHAGVIGAALVAFEVLDGGR